MKINLLVACLEGHPAATVCTQIVPTLDAAIAGQTARIDDALPTMAAMQPDVLLLEYIEAEAHRAWQVMSRIAGVSRSTRVLLVCDLYTQRSVVDFIQHGASGCLLASSEPSLYAKAVRAVHQGETWFGRAELLQALRSQMHADPVVASDVLDDQELLTAREREILALIGSAMSNKEIARQLNISDQTVKTHLHHIYVKLEKSGRYKAFLSNAVAAPAPHPVSPSRLQ